MLLTGAGGFIGGHVRRHLASDPRLSVSPATRDGRDRTVRLDVRQPDAAALAGMDAVVHCAVGGRDVTVDGTRAMLRAAEAAGVRRFVHLSSVAVYGAAAGVVMEETAAVAPDGSGYAAWKAAAEQACMQQAGIETVRLRPAIVYGAGSALWVTGLAHRIRSGRWGVFGAAGDGTCNLVHVSDVATAVAAALTAPRAAGRAFNVNGPQAVSWNEWFALLAHGIGAPPLRAVPPAILRARTLAALPVKAMARLRPGLGSEWLLGAPARSELALFAQKATYPVFAAREALGWAPAVDVAAGLAESLACLPRDRLAA